ncbi:hypothetical protein BYT27DRAFT_7335099 [Phlegmacium glaucopus]|nr:hypothetical protein BYT27DRAFT_7335099 [Phlegmacium glaucopus]
MMFLLSFAFCALSVNAYWLMGIEDFITTERIDPIINPGKVSSHAHSVLGGSNFRFNTSTASLRQSPCTSVPIPQDKSSYWFPNLYFQWNNGSFTSLNGGAVMYYLFSDKPGTTTAFPDDFRMISGTPTLRTYDATSSAQRAVTFLCLDFNGKSVTYNFLPPTTCPSGIRAQINFPSCWDGKNLDSPDHKSHVAFLSGGPDSGTCSDPKFPVVLPRIFMEVYWSSHDFDSVRSQAMNSTQPFVFSQGDPTGFGYHADYINGWDQGVLQRAVDNCHCDEFGDPTCCVNQGIFNMNHNQQCHITKSIDEQTTGTLLKLPGNNPVQPEGKTATTFTDNVTPPLIEPVYAYTGDSPTATGQIVTPGQTNPVAPPPVVPVTVSSGSHTTVTVPSVPVPTVPTTHATTPPIAIPSLPPVVKSGLPTASVLAAIPTAPHATQPSPPAASPPAAAGVASSSNSDPSSPKTCKSRRVKKRQLGLEYHRQHRRSPLVPRHDSVYEAMN